MNFAEYLRPKELKDFIGQKHLVDINAPFYKLLVANKLPHSFFFGPSGVGKTTLARIVANYNNNPFYEFNATSIKIDDLRKILQINKNSLIKPIIFIDEVHRLSKNQQEVMLPFMERFDAIFFGASTENPFFTLTSAIRSRGMLFEFKPLSFIDLESLLNRVINIEKIKINKDAKEYLIYSSGGDARAMLNLLEYSKIIDKNIDLKTLKQLRSNALNDGTSSNETHYNLISAFIKSIRGSDENASIYYLARLIKGGEDPKYIARRLLILASEDIGNANPNALNLANSTFQAVSNIGYPEARIILSQLVIYLAASPKSNSAYISIDNAIKAIENGDIQDIPNYLKDSHFSGAKEQNRGVGYKYPHNFGGYVEQKYMKENREFVKLKPIGFEKTVIEWLNLSSHS